MQYEVTYWDKDYGSVYTKQVLKACGKHGYH